MTKHDLTLENMQDIKSVVTLITEYIQNNDLMPNTLLISLGSERFEGVTEIARLQVLRVANVPIDYMKVAFV